MKSPFFLFLCLLSFFKPLISSERGSSYPYISGDTFRAYSNYYYDETGGNFHPYKVKEGDIIFVKTEKLKKFIISIHKKIRHKYILITHNSDLPIPGRFASFLDDEKLIAWFGQNVEGSAHPKLHPIPIGLANKKWNHGNTDLVKQKQVSLTATNRNLLLYMNFSVHTHFKERSFVANLFMNKSYCTCAPIKPYELYLEDLRNAKFVLSPRGNGLDCHRTWEALLLGAIPVVKTSSLDPLYENLPVLIINDWSLLDKKLLNQKYAEIKNRPYKEERLYFDYWWKKIKAYQELYQTKKG